MIMMKLMKILCCLFLLAFFTLFLILPVFTVVEEGLRWDLVREILENKIYLLCAGRSNLGKCDALFRFDIRELEKNVEEQIRDVLRTVPPDGSVPDPGGRAEALLSIERKIERLVTALSESSDVSVFYISRQIDRLHRERERLLNDARTSAHPMRSIDFAAADFEEKKIIAGQLIEKILLDGQQVNIFWKI